MAHIHLVGIGGAGLSAIAAVLLQQRHTVSGSDMQASPAVARLRQMGANVTIGHQSKNITRPDAVVISSAVPASNVEVRAAQAKDIPVFKRPAWLGRMMAGKRGVAIAGAHGKTTTTAMTALILQQAGLSPTYIIGGYVPQLKGNAAAGKGDLFVIEADEYDRTFLSLKPEVAVITNIERDHPDTYPTDAALFAAFAEFAGLVPAHGYTLLCGDDPGAQKLAAGLPAAETYGLKAGNHWQAVNAEPGPAGGFQFEVRYQGRAMLLKPLSLRAPGLHNVQNGLAALAVATRLGVPVGRAAQSLAEFGGTERRFQLKGEAHGVTVIDDYAHNPTELRATLAAAHARFGARPIWAVFQPHTFSRTKLLLPRFGPAFAQADHVIVLDIYPSREKDDGSVSSADILKHTVHPDARRLGMPAAVDYLQQHLQPGDVLITLGAGDGDKVGENILTFFNKGQANHDD